MDAKVPRPKRPRREPAPTTPDPIEIAMEAEAGDPSPDSPARRLLVDQGKLVRWQIAGERAGFALKCLAGAAALALSAGLGAMMWAAHQDHGLFIEAFETPPDLAERGLSGKVLATALQDRLTQMQAETVTPFEPRAVNNRWTGEIKVVIPQTGVSLGELNRLLRDWLGASTHVSGEVIHTSEGRLALTVRAGAAAGTRTEGPDSGIHGLVQAAAESVYGSTQPIRYASWLQQHGRDADAEALLRVATGQGDPAERARAYVMLGQYERNPQAGLDLARRAQRLDPKSGMVIGNLSQAEDTMGHLQAAVDLSRESLRLFQRDRSLSESGRRFSYYVNLSNRETWMGAYLDSVADADRQAEESGAEEQVTRNRLSDAQAVVLAHDVQGARRLTASLTPVGPESPERDQKRYRRMMLFQAGREAIELEDWPAAFAAYAAATDAADFPEAEFKGNAQSLRAYVAARVGRFAEAEAGVAGVPLDNYRGLVMRGRIAALKGDWAGAEAWFAKAERLGPQLPFAPTERGRMLLARGDARAAAGALAIACERSPHYADPRELLGEAMVAQGDHAGASATFAEAAKHAPRWGRLHLKWGEALAKLGKADEARAKFRAAAGMDLTAVERAELTRVQGAK